MKLKLITKIMNQLFIYSKNPPVNGLDIMSMFVFICLMLNMSFNEKLFFPDLRIMSFCGEFHKNRDIFLHDIFRDGSLSLYEDHMPRTKIFDEYIFRKLFGHACTCPNYEIYVYHL